MKAALVSFVLLLGLLPAMALGMELSEGVVAQGVEQRQPVEVANHFPSAVGRIYCFTRVTGASGEEEVTHVWLKQGREMARVSLPVRSNDWRTWSSKRILPEWKGEWTVKILDSAGNELGSVPFTLD